MAELLGIVAGGAGLASLALQLVDGGQKLRQRYKNVKGLGGNITWLSEDVELIGKQLMQLETSADDIMQEQLGPIMMGRCRDRSARVADRLASLASQWKGELGELQVLVTGLKQDISQYTTPLLSACTASGMFWCLQYSPLAEIFKACDNPACSARRYRFDLRLTLYGYGVPLKAALGFDLITEPGRYSLQPCLQIETVVDFDAPGFVILEKLAFEEIDWATAEIEFKDLYKGCPGFVNQVDPLGRGYLEDGLPFTSLEPYSCYDDPFHLFFMKAILAVNPDFGDNPPLHTSLLFGSDEDFKFCLERNTQPFEKIVNFLGQSALHIAVFEPSRVAQLLAAGHPVDLSDENGTTPLIYAAAVNMPDSVMILAKNGAKLLFPLTGHTIFHNTIWPDWNLVWQIIDFASASHPDLIPQLIKDLLLHSYVTIDEEFYSAYASDIGFWSRIISTLGSANFTFDDGTTLMHMTRDSQSARALIKLGFGEFNQNTTDLLQHLASLHDSFLFQIAFANGGDALLQNGWGWDVADRLLHELIRYGWKGVPEILKTLQLILDKRSQFPPRHDRDRVCVCIRRDRGRVAGWHWLLKAFAWLEILERYGMIARAKQVSLTLLRQMYFHQAGLHHTFCIICNSDLVDDTDNDRFWDISEQTSIDSLNREIIDLSTKPYPILKLEVMVYVRRVWKKEYAKQWPGPRLSPSWRSLIRREREGGLKKLLQVIRTSKYSAIPEPFSSNWDRIVQKKLESDHWTLEYDLELGVVELGVGVYQCRGDQFTSWIPLLTQLTDVLLAEEPGVSES
ncbi:hypothetical protein FNAPI_1909 [Fusarium napiforme]|uniref:Ankyrin n=1 Tax=Fusarium napiforme TaxID=42672 RepID=A0A8H5K2J2_9HYPO|nr:hypothetical protein FNAPI_1909 [Fusarium napiforme]